jgi:short-subunit dehydrogenase
MPMKVSTLIRGVAAVLATGLVAGLATRARRGMRLEGKTVLVGGASRGLGRAIALECGRRGARVAICARSGKDLDAVRAELVALGVRVHAEACDLRSMDQVENLVANVTERLGPIDLLVANAATIVVGPVEDMKPEDFEDALDEIFKTSLNAALAVLPRMRARRKGHMTFIASIGGKIAVPHLLPYAAAKFAEVGFAEGLRAEIAKDGIHVLTVIPGLMRTGSHVHASFKGDAEQEYAWFGASATSPMPMTIGAERAAKRVVRAIERGDTELVLTPIAKLAVAVHGLAPSFFASLMGIAGRLLPASPKNGAGSVRRREGIDIERTSPSRAVAFVGRRGRALAERNHQLG